jgi:cytochrome c-type biogenesis protein CcmH
MAAAAGNKPTPDAEAALNKALALDPNNQAALYYLGGARAADGDGAGAAKLWRRLAALLPDNDGRRAPLLATADQVENGQAAGPAAPSAPPPASAMSGDQAGFIRGMVASLKARLDASPDDPAGWARLVRSYRVLGDKPAAVAALAKARTLFKDRPKDLGLIEAEAK